MPNLPAGACGGVKRVLAAALVLGIGVLAGCGPGGPGASPCPSGPTRAPVASVEVVNRYPHDPEAFTQGLVYDSGGERLYESTGRLGESTVREVELDTGTVLRSVALSPEYFGEGLALLDERLYQLTWQNGIGFVYRSSDLTQTDTFRFDGEGWGLTTDGSLLILSNGSSQLRLIEPGTFRVTRTVEVTDGGAPVEALNELEWIDGEVWANVWRTERIARIDPETGRVRGWIDLTGLLPAEERADPAAVPNGIAHHSTAGRTFVTGKLWPALFEIEVGAPTPRCG